MSKRIKLKDITNSISVSYENFETEIVPVDIQKNDGRKNTWMN